MPYIQHTCTYRTNIGNTATSSNAFYTNKYTTQSKYNAQDVNKSSKYIKMASSSQQRELLRDIINSASPRALKLNTVSLIA